MSESELAFLERESVDLSDENAETRRNLQLIIRVRWIIAPAVYVQAAASACLFPPILSAASAISTAENRALTLSLSLAVAPVVGGGLLPAGIALAGDLGSFGTGLAAAGLLIVAGIGLVPRLSPKA